MPPVHSISSGLWGLSHMGFSVGVSTLSGLLMLLASLGGSRRSFGECRRFPVRLKFLLFHCALAGLGAGLVAYSGVRLLTLGAGDWIGWLSFALGFVLVLLVVSAWPGPLVFDWEGVFEKGNESGRIRWEDIRLVHEFQSRRDRGLLIHSRTGRSLTVSFTTYRCDEVMASLTHEWSVPVQPLEAEPVYRTPAASHNTVAHPIPTLNSDTTPPQ